MEVALALALTFSTGVIDAAGFLGLDRVFTGNMTGNVAILGMALAGADDLPIVGPVVALLSFLMGVAAAGRAARCAADGWSAVTTVLLAIVAVLLLVSGGLAVLLVEADSMTVLTVLLGLGMGIQAGAARAIAVKDVTTVVVTSTLVGLAYDSRLAAGNSHPWARRLLAVALLGAGAFAGAILLTVHFSASVSVAAVVTGIVTFVGEHHRRVRDPHRDEGEVA